MTKYQSKTKDFQINQSTRKAKTSSASGMVRIIGGSMRGRKVRFPTAAGLRPTMDRIRETVFNWLAYDVVNADCLDLFAGSGAMGFEAASRGANSVVCVEKNAKVARSLEDNRQQFELDHFKIVNLDAERYLKNCDQTFDIIFLDPPFGEGILASHFEWLKRCVKPSSLIYIEQEQSDTPFIPPPPWQILKNKSTGSFIYSLYCQSNDVL